MRRIFFIAVLLLQFSSRPCFSQSENSTVKNNAGWLSLGMRSTMSVFSDDGFGLGTGGQFRIQLSNSVNTDWFADYIVVNGSDNIRSEFYHIGWSVLFYPFDKLQYPSSKFQPFILAGHCFDYNNKSLIDQPAIQKDRWGSAVQAGIGTHLFLSDRFDVTFLSQYMIHLTKELELEQENGEWNFAESKGSLMEGHLLTTISVNYKLCRLW